MSLRPTVIAGIASGSYVGVLVGYSIGIYVEKNYFSPAQEVRVTPLSATVSSLRGTTTLAYDPITNTYRLPQAIVDDRTKTVKDSLDTVISRPGK